MPWIVLASLLVVTALFTQLYLATRAENIVYAQEQQLSDIEARSLRNQLEAERILTREQITFMRGQAQPDAAATAALQVFFLTHPDYSTIIGVVVWDKAHYEGLLVTSNLVPAPPGQTYNLWLTDAQSQVARNAGPIVLNGNDTDARFTFKSASPIPTPTGFVLSLESAANSAPSGIGRVILRSH